MISEKFKSLVSRFVPSGNDECKCGGEYFDAPNSMLFLQGEEEVSVGWVEKDAVYVKSQTVRRKYVCMGCGREYTIVTSELLEGEDNLVKKEDIWLGEEDMEEYLDEEDQNHVIGGAFYNGSRWWEDNRLPKLRENSEVDEVGVGHIPGDMQADSSTPCADEEHIPSSVDSSGDSEQQGGE